MYIFKVVVGHFLTFDIHFEQCGLVPWLVVATLGTIECGSLDPVGEIALVAKEYGCWIHVDAAVGGYFMICEQFSELKKGDVTWNYDQ